MDDTLIQLEFLKNAMFSSDLHLSALTFTYGSEEKRKRKRKMFYFNLI